MIPRRTFLSSLAALLVPWRKRPRKLSRDECLDLMLSRPVPPGFGDALRRIERVAEVEQRFGLANGKLQIDHFGGIEDLLVAEDVDGTIKPLSELSYRPDCGWG